MRFEKGQHIVCKVHKFGWFHVDTGESCAGPDTNELVTADGYADDTHVLLKEYPDDEGYEDRHFEPLVSDEFLRSELATVPEPFTL